MPSPDVPTRWRRLPGMLGTLRTAVALVAASARRELIITFVLSLVGSAAVALELIVIREVVDQVTSDAGSTAELVPLLVILAAAMVTAALAGTAVGELRVLLSDLVQREATARLLAAATNAELEAFEDAEFHDRVQRARDHAESAAWSVVWGLVALVTATISVLAVSVVLFSVAPLLVGVAAIAVVPLVVSATLNTRLLYRMEYDLAEIDRDREYHARLMTSRTDAKEVRAFGLAPWLLRRHGALFDERIVHTRRVVRQRTGRALIGSALTTLILVAALGIVGSLVIDERINISAGAVGVLALQQIGGRLRSVGDALSSIVEGVAFFRDFEAFQDQTSTAVAMPPEPLAPAPRRIEVDRLGYTYPTADRPAISDISLTLEPGKVVALVGPNGSGKSTLAKVLCGLLPPTEGHLRWDGVDAQEVDPRQWRALVAPVFQDFTRYEHRAAESIAFGGVGADPEAPIDTGRVAAAADEAGAAGFIEALPLGYDTRLSTAYRGGTDLSGGQWQRMAIARAFYRDAPLVVMDEPAASLDPLAEQALVEHLGKLGEGKMVVFVSHRFTAVQHADEIIVLVDGRAVERGPHDELMERDGIYAGMYRVQRGSGEG